MTDDHLSRISTQWSLVIQAHQSDSDAALRAQKDLLVRYFGAIYRYVRALVRDMDVTEDVCQDFAVRFVRGDLRRANPASGRFRDYVKTTIYHLIVDSQRRRKGKESPLPANGELEVVAPTPPQEDFLDHWREELLERTWQALKQTQPQATPYFEALRCRSQFPQAAIADITAKLSAELNRPLTEASVRQWVHRARERFADLLVYEIGRSIESNDREQIENEVIALGLQPYCRSALKRRG